MRNYSGWVGGSEPFRDLRKFSKETVRLLQGAGFGTYLFRAVDSSLLSFLTSIQQLRLHLLVYSKPVPLLKSRVAELGSERSTWSSTTTSSSHVQIGRVLLPPSKGAPRYIPHIDHLVLIFVVLLLKSCSPPLSPAPLAPLSVAPIPNMLSVLCTDDCSPS